MYTVLVDILFSYVRVVNKIEIEEVLAWLTQKDHRGNHVEWRRATKTTEAGAATAQPEASEAHWTNTKKQKHYMFRFISFIKI